MEYILLFFISFLSNLFSAFSGGGAGIIQLPAILLLYEISFPVALATHKISTVLLGVGASIKFFEKNKPDKSYVLNIEKTYENISNFFREILTTTIPSDMDEDTKKLEYYKKLFFRNVLYMIILSHGEGENSSLSMQLGKLESKNIYLSSSKDK